MTEIILRNQAPDFVGTEMTLVEATTNGEGARVNTKRF